MGRDKGALEYHGEPQAVHAWRLLTDICGRAYVSTNARHAGFAPYSDLPLIVDDEDYRGPASGLAAAWQWHRDAAWLALAVDMPLVDHALLSELVEGRDPQRLATAFRHPDGTFEPVCTIWEPAACVPLLEQVAGGDASLRRFLEAQRIATLTPSAPGRLRHVNDPAAYRAVLDELAAL